MTPIDQLTQDLATAQAEIANAYAGFRLILEEHYPFANSLVRDDCTNLLASIGNRLNELEALSQSSPSLQGYVLAPKEPTEEMIRAACLNQAVKEPTKNSPARFFTSYEEWADSHSNGIVERIRNLQINDYKAMINALKGK